MKPALLSHRGFCRRQRSDDRREMKRLLDWAVLLLLFTFVLYFHIRCQKRTRTVGLALPSANSFVQTVQTFFWFVCFVSESGRKMSEDAFIPPPSSSFVTCRGTAGAHVPHTPYCAHHICPYLWSRHPCPTPLLAAGDHADNLPSHKLA